MIKNSFNLIWTHARFEMLTLLRGWFFRIFAVAAIGLLILLNIIFYTTATDIPWLFKGLPSFMPYTNVLLLSIVQVVVLLFLATDILKRDRKMNSTQVIYIHSMSNLEYLSGKALGILILFSGLSILHLFITAGINIIFCDAPFVLMPYLIYPVLISLPAFVFILGLTFLLIRLIRNQAVVAILLLGYIALIFFYLHDKFYFIFDFFALNQPLIYSDFVGIPNLTPVLYHRCLYLVIGVSFLLLTSFIFPRLPQSIKIRRISLALAVLFLLGGGGFSSAYLNSFRDGEQLREKMKTINSQLVNSIFVTPKNCKIDITHSGNKLEANIRIVFKNESDVPIDQYIYSLNPGLKVSNVFKQDKKVEFKQNVHIIEINPASPLMPGELDSIRIEYSGTINEQAAYIEIDEQNRQELYYIWLYKIAKKYAFLQKDFVLLSPECLWYPVAGIPYGMCFPDKGNQYYIDFELWVSTDKKFTVISQGKALADQAGTYHFKPENSLSGLSLIIGKYEKQSINVDDIEYSIYSFPGHDYYKEYFTEIGDTLEAIIREAKQDYERDLELDYPFKRLNFVEVPVQFFTYPRIWTVASARVQPEQVWIPEYGISLGSADFKNMAKRQEGRRSRSNITMTEQENQVLLLKRFLGSTFLGDNPRRGFGDAALISAQPNLNLFPNYFTHSVNFYSDSLSLFKLALEAYFYEKVSIKGEISSWFTENLTKGELVSRELSHKSLKDQFNAIEQDDLLPDMLKIKGSFLVKLLQAEINNQDFNQYLVNKIESQRFSAINVEEIITYIKDRFKVNLIPYISAWYEDENLPGYLIDDMQMFKILDGDRLRYQVIFKIANPEPATALIDVSFRTGDRRRWMLGGSEEQEPVRQIKLEAGTAKEIGIVLDSEPRLIYMNPTISLNIPLVFAKRFERAELRKKYKPFDGERKLDKLFDLYLENEIIVDNEDDGFKAQNLSYQSSIKRLIHGDDNNPSDEFVRFRFWRPPNQWNLIKNAGFFGKYIHSARFIRSGKGEQQAVWNAEISTNGFYSVYTYIVNRMAFGRRGRDYKIIGECHYIIYHDDGTDEITIDAGKAEEGWNFLGSYYFSKGVAKVVMTNESNERMVIADAIKWVKN